MKNEISNLEYCELYESYGSYELTRPLPHNSNYSFRSILNKMQFHELYES